MCHVVKNPWKQSSTKAWWKLMDIFWVEQLWSVLYAALQRSPCVWDPIAHMCNLLIVGVQSLNRVVLFATPWTAACQASLSFPISQSLLKFMSTESVMLFDHPLPPSSPAFNLSNIRVFSKESALCIRWPRYSSFNISPSNEYSGWICFGIDHSGLLIVKKGFTVFSSTTIWKHQFFGTHPSLWPKFSHLHMTTGKKHTFD